MAMTASMLSLCFTLALAGVALLLLALRGLLRAVRSPRPTNSYVWAAGLILTVGLLAIDTVVLWCLIEYGLFGVDFSTQGLHALMNRAGIWAPLASIALMAAHAFVPFPAELIAIANGLVFGPGLGILITWLGAMLGAMLSYELARALGPTARNRLVPQRYRAHLARFANNRSAASLLVARLIPLISFNLINYAAGLTGVPRRTFVWTTGLGILPLTAISVLFGSQALQWPVYVWILVGLTVLLFLAAMRWARRTRPHTATHRSGPTP